MTGGGTALVVYCYYSTLHNYKLKYRRKQLIGGRNDAKSLQRREWRLLVVVGWEFLPRKSDNDYRLGWEIQASFWGVCERVGKTRLEGGSAKIDFYSPIWARMCGSIW